jgi:hypothetical protein
MDMNLLGVKQQRNLSWDGEKTESRFASCCFPFFQSHLFLICGSVICAKEGSEDVRF